MLGVAILFVIIFLVMEAQLFWVCIPKKGWQTLPNPQCSLGTQVGVLQLVSKCISSQYIPRESSREPSTADIISDILLIAFPLKLFQDLHEKYLRRRLMIIFSTALATSIVSLPHAALILTNAGPKVLIAAVAEVTSLCYLFQSIPLTVVQDLRIVSRL